MRLLYSNSEVKGYTVALSLVLFIFMSIFLVVNNNYINNQKEAYINIVGSVISKAVELEPSLEKELIPLVVRDISMEDRVKGEEFLKKYGITNALDSELFPNYSRNTGVIVILISFGLLLILLNYMQLTYIFKKIRKLTLAANKILDDEYNVLINEEKEGDLSKLCLAFSNIRNIIRNNLSTMEKEKIYLIELVQNISHQLKTRLSTMVLYNDILLNRQLSEEQRKSFLMENEIQINKMNEIIHSILKLAKLDARTIDFQMSDKNLNKTIEKVVYALQGVAKEKGINLTINDNELMILPHDSFWIQEAFTNIIKNAIDHTPTQGRVEINLFNSPGYYRIVVKDTGSGINQEDIPNIFNRFYKAKNSNKSDSVGIGLAITKAIIEGHNGYIDVRSEINRGTMFQATFLKY